jgi:hypothetical protein
LAPRKAERFRRAEFDSKRDGETSLPRSVRAIAKILPRRFFRGSCQLLQPEEEIDQLLDVALVQPEGPASPMRYATITDGYPHSKGASRPRRGRWRDKAQAACAAFFVLRWALTGAIWLKVSRRG